MNKNLKGLLTVIGVTAAGYGLYTIMTAPKIEFTKIDWSAKTVDFEMSARNKKFLGKYNPSETPQSLKSGNWSFEVNKINDDMVDFMIKQNGKTKAERTIQFSSKNISN